jgi:hypothetical protein
MRGECRFEVLFRRIERQIPDIDPQFLLLISDPARAALFHGEPRWRLPTPWDSIGNVEAEVGTDDSDRFAAV